MVIGAKFAVKRARRILQIQAMVMLTSILSFVHEPKKGGDMQSQLRLWQHSMGPKAVMLDVLFQAGNYCGYMKIWSMIGCLRDRGKTAIKATGKDNKSVIIYDNRNQRHREAH